MMIVRAQLLVPSANREVLKALHDSAHGGGDLGVKRTTEKISEKFYWSHWRASVTTCQLCDQRKQPSTTPNAELLPSSELSPIQ